jgi:hypothetical protein
MCWVLVMELRKKVVDQYPRVNFKQDIARLSSVALNIRAGRPMGTCNEDICVRFIRNYRRSNFYDQIQNSPFQHS